jgi:hypothetical protein
MPTVRSSVLLLLAVLTISPAAAGAQSAVHATLSGHVEDPSGRVVPGAVVVLSNLDTDTVQTATTAPDGGFRFVRVTPARYTIEANLDGFGRARQELVLAVNDAAVVTLVLPLAAVDTNVTVEAPLSRSAAVSSIVDSEQIRELPLNSRGFQRLMLLAPGMATAGTRGSPSNPSVSGTRNTSNNYVVDGMSANEERVGSAGLAPGSPSGLAVPDVISTEALQEFRVITSNADASFGRGAGAQINVVTKSGSNTFRGATYEYFRHNRLDARDFFNQGPYFDDRGKPIAPPLRYHLFGATAGGPIVPARHFFFASYEGFRQREDLVANQTLPNAALMELIPGDLGRFFRSSLIDTGFIPATGNRPGDLRSFSAADRAAAVTAGFPGALFDGSPTNGEAGVVVSSVPQPREYVQNALLIRTDHHLNKRLTLTARYARTRNVFDRSSGRPGTLVNTTRDFDSGLGQLVATLSPAQLLEVRGGWLWNRAPVCSPDIPRELAALDPAERGINLTLTGTTAFSLPFLSVPCTFVDTQTVPQAAAVHTWARGGLTLRSGFDLRFVGYDFANLGLGSPTYQFTGLVGPTGLLGTTPGQTESIATAYTATYFGGNGLPSTPQRKYRSLQHEYFAQADWQLSSRLTMNAGVRYSIFGVYRIDGAANLFAVDPASGAVVPDTSPFAHGRTANRVEVVGDSLPPYRRDLDNLQPRIGVSWDLTGEGRSIVKGAYGIYHDRLFQFAFANLVVNAPFALSGSAPATPFRLGTLPALNPATPGVFAIDPSIRNPYFHRASVGVDQQLGRGTSVFAGYVGTFGRDLARIVDLNFGAGFPQASRPDPRYAEMLMLTNISTSRYDALQVQLRSHPRPGLSATVAYTYSRLNDYTHSDTIGAGQQIPTVLINQGASAAAGFQVGSFADQALDAYAGRSDQDLPHALAVSHVVEVPFGRGRRWGADALSAVDALLGGWSVAGILQARSGAPVNITLGRDVNDDGYVTDRPALLSGTLDDLYSGAGSKTQYLIPQNDAIARLGVSAVVTDAFAQIPYNALRAPNVWTYDLSLQKQLAFGRTRLAIELNAFNVFNRTNLAAPNANLSSALFGTITSTAPGFGPRQLQLGARLTF